MKPVRIDFASSSLGRGIWRASFVTWSLVAVACAAAALVVLQFLQYEKQLDEFERSKAASIRADSAHSFAAKPRISRQLSEVNLAAVNSMIAKLNVPWRAFYEAIQLSTPESVALITLEPDSGKNSVRITAEARDSDEMVAYIEQIRRNGFFSKVTLARHEIVELDRNRPIRFELEAQWSVQQ